MKKQWPTKPLGDVFETVTGNTPPKSNAAYFGRHMPLVKPPELTDGEVTTAEDGLSEEGSRVARIAPPGSILVSCIGNLGKVGLNSVPVAFNQQINAIIPNRAEAIPEFVFYQVLSCRFRDQLDSLAAGTTVAIVNKSRFNSIELALPPLPEQQRIVGVLDEAFAGLTIAQAHAEKNLRSARALFESHVQSVFTRRGKEWVEKPLIDVCELFFDSAHRTPKYVEDGIPALRPRDVVNGVLNLAGALRVSEAEYEVQSKRYRPSPGDIVYSRELSYGWAAILPDSPRVCLSQGMCVFRASSSLVPAFLVYVLNGSVGRQQADRAAVGAAHPHINLGEIKAYSIPFPPLASQEQIVANIDALATETQRLENLCEKKLEGLSVLKKSLLHDAFSGAL